MSFGELSIGEISFQRIVYSGNCPLEICPSGKSLWRTVRRETVQTPNEIVQKLNHSVLLAGAKSHCFSNLVFLLKLCCSGSEVSFGGKKFCHNSSCLLWRHQIRQKNLPKSMVLTWWKNFLHISSQPEACGTWLLGGFH